MQRTLAAKERAPRGHARSQAAGRREMRPARRAWVGIACGLALGLGGVVAVDAATESADAQASEVEVTSAQLLINQRISQAAVRRSNRALNYLAPIRSAQSDAADDGRKGVIALKDIPGAGQGWTTAQIADDAITTPKLGDGAVTGPKLGADAVTSEKIATGAVDTGEIAQGAVATDDVADGAITGPKIAPDSVDGSKVQDGSITFRDLQVVDAGSGGASGTQFNIPPDGCLPFGGSPGFPAGSLVINSLDSGSPPYGFYIPVTTVQQDGIAWTVFCNFTATVINMGPFRVTTRVLPSGAG